MKTARRTLEDLKNSRDAIAKRWLSRTGQGDLPEEPLENYLDVLIFSYNMKLYLVLLRLNTTGQLNLGPQAKNSMLSSTPGPATYGFHLKLAQSGSWLAVSKTKS